MRIFIAISLKVILLIIIIVALVTPFTFLIPSSSTDSSYHSVILPDFTKMTDVKLKKSSFFNFLKPAIIEVNDAIKHDRARLLMIHDTLISNHEMTQPMIRFISAQQQKYRVNTKGSYLAQIQELFMHVDVIPQALVLVQAANESAWGTSRFAREGLNFFGLWCFEKGCGMVPNSRVEGATHEVMTFSSVEKAVEGYVTNINRHKAYNGLRIIRSNLRNAKKPITAEQLANGLFAYSERGQEYVTEIQTMLKQNAKYLK